MTIIFILLCIHALFAQVDASHYFTPKGVFDTVYYGLGSKCALNDILVKTPQNQDRLRTLGIGNTAPLTQLSSCGNTGYFKLYLETGCGFDIDPVANATLCQVFHDISEFITPVNSPSGTPAFVNILIKDPGRAHLDPAYLGVSSAFTAVPKLLPNQTGIADNQVWKTINSGVDAYSDAALPLIWLQYTQPLEFYHGSITFNLLPHNWQKDCALAPASAQYDLYNTLLHEVIHALGFESYMTPDGLSRMNYYVPGFTYYRRFDTYLETAGRDRLLVNSSGCGLQNWQANSAIAFAAPGSLMGGPLSPNCPSSLGYPPDETDCNTAIRYHTPSVDQAVYTPACFENGSSCSHFEDECLPIPLNNGYFVMSNVGPLGLIKHYLKSQERSVLCDLGYNVSGKYGQNPLLNPSNPAPVIDGYFDYGTTGCTSAKLVGRNDGINAQGEFEYHTQLNTATPLYIANFTGNDKLTLDNTLTPLSTADAAAAITVSCLEVIRGAGTITNFNGVNGGAFDYAPTRLGLHLLRYTPISGNLVGSIAYIFVWVDSDPASCAVSTNCDFIVNGNFESVQGDCGVVWDYQPSPAISCWNTLYGTPDVFSRTCGTVNYDIGYKFPTSALGGAPLAPDVWDGNLQNAHYIGLALIKKTGESYAEAVQTRLLMPLTAGEEYELRFKAKVDRGPYVNQIPNNIDAPLFFGLTENTLPVPVNTHYWPAYQPNIQVLQTTIIPNNGRWIDNTILFTCPAGANLRNFIIGYDIRQVPTSSKAYVLLDEISIHKVTDVLPVNAPVCMSLGATSDLTQLNTPNNITFTSSNNDLTIDANNHAIFTATAAGTHTIHYSYHIPPNNCIISDVKLINVSDDHVTITGGANQCAVFATQPLTASGGANYVWNTGEVGAAIQTTVSYSIYTVTATKCDGTTMTASITVVTNTALNIVGDGCISAQPNGATTLTADAPNAATISYAYLWSTGETTPQITAIAAGDYSVTVTDALNGCTAASSRAIGQTPTIQSLTATSSFISAGQTVTLTTTILPTTYPLYRWSTNVSGASLNSIDITAPGTYTVTVSNGTDALCSATASITITAPPSCVSPTNQLILGSNTPYPTIRDAITAQVIPAGTMTGGNIGIDGDLAINDNYYFDGVEINIGGGGSITVEKTVTFLSTNLAGLGCLWQGIDVQPNGKLIMKGCSISDAYRAVTATKGAVSLQNNSFDRNYVGLYSSNFFVLTYFSGNVFDCTGVLANPYPGITVGNWAYAGVELHDADYVNLALTANNLHINTFQNLNCGIVAEGATYLNVLWARFKNITKHYTNAHDGAGIAALHDADIYHEGRSVFENPTTFSEYDNCDFGIYADNAQAVSRYNTFSDCGVSVYAQNATADNAIAVQWGRIQNRNKGNYGVWCQMCDNAEAVEVDGNIIQLSNTLTGVVAAIAYNGAGIANNASFNHAITNNDIRQGNAPDGIRILNHSNVLVSGNAVNIRNTSCRNGINIESANNAYVKCNTVTGNGSTQNNNADPYEPIGIRVVASTGGRYHSNYTGDLWTGAYFNIDCSTTDLKQNIFATSHTGLNMGSTLVMNSQDNKGNLWIGNQFTNSAKHDGLAQSGVLQGRIKTNTANNGAFTILGEYWAANAATVSQPNAPLADWFVSSTDTQAHDDDCVVFQSAIPPIVIGDNDILIAEGDLRIADYPEEMKKWTTLTFYEKLKEHPELVLPYSVLAHFRDSIETTVFDDLYANFKARTTTVKMQPALKTSLTAKRLTIKSILDGLRLTDSLFVADSTHIDTTILAQRKAQMTALKTVKTDYKTSKNDYYTLREARSTAAKAENTFLVPTELHAYNEKSVNEIYFTTVAKGNLNYTESQKIILANIAQQCPIIGGRSVYTARAMYASVANIPYNDITTCAFQNVNFRTQQPQKPTVKTSTPDIISVKVFPNPANNLVTLQVNKALEENATVVLTDILGRVVYNTVLVQGSIMLPITVSDWAEGIYTYRVILNNNAISLGKLTIIK